MGSRGESSPFVAEQVRQGRWREEELPPEMTGLSRPLRVFLAQRRRKSMITHAEFGSAETFCPGNWYDLGLGSGSCGLQCRACFLMLTWRDWRDPHRHVLSENVGEIVVAVQEWLREATRRATDVLGVGVDRSDSLLYEGRVPVVRQLAPLFADPTANPQGCRLLLLTKTANVRYLREIPPEQRRALIVSFSLNPQGIADLWEGQYPDGERIPPTIAERLAAAREAQDLGYEVRARVDPILWPEHWLDMYWAFVQEVAARGLKFRRWTLGSYREKAAQLDTWRGKWQLPALGWEPPRTEFVRDGTHFRIPAEQRVALYAGVVGAIRRVFPEAEVGLCKETHAVWRALGLGRRTCNCLP